MEGVVSASFAGALGALLGAATVAIPLLSLLKKLRSEQKQTRTAVENLATSLHESQAWFWTPEWQEGEREADEDLAAGRTTKFKSPELLDDYLDHYPSSVTAGR